jgi:hypothetical protein
MLTQVSTSKMAEAKALTSFEARSEELAQMMRLFDRKEGQLVTFDAITAGKQGFTPEGIALAEEMKAFSNDVLIASRDAEKDTSASIARDLDLVVKKYPSVSAYFQAATEYNATVDGKQILMPESQPTTIIGRMQHCGWFLNPRPSRSADWRTYKRPNPAATLSALGYHETPRNIFGGGWTRPQSWHPVVCGWNTYRDHAVIESARQFREQSYSGWTPRGEPNPEVWRSGPWPYPTWPTYVYWWHRTH